MANDFSTDGHCVAVWRFEAAPGIDQDSKGSNHFTMVDVTAEGTIVKEGSQSVEFQKDTASIATIADADLDAGFPFRFLDASPIPNFTSSTWIYCVNAPSVSGIGFEVFRKYLSAGFRTMYIYINQTNDKLYFLKGYNSGNSVESVAHASPFVAGRWYHIFIGYRESDKTTFVTIWDDTAGAVHGVDVSGTFIQTTSIQDVYFRLAYASDAIYDECVVWNIKKNPSDAADIIAGTYSFEGRQYHSLNKIQFEVDSNLNM